MIRLVRARAVGVAGVVLATLLVGGCGDDGGDGGGGGGTDDPQAVCDDVEALRSSLTALTDVTLGADTLTSLQDLLDQTRTDVSTLITDAQDAYADEVDAVDQAVSGLSTSVEDAIAKPSAATLADVRTARQQLSTSVSSLSTAVQDTC